MADHFVHGKSDNLCMLLADVYNVALSHGCVPSLDWAQAWHADKIKSTSATTGLGWVYGREQRLPSGK